MPKNTLELVKHLMQIIHITLISSGQILVAYISTLAFTFLKHFVFPGPALSRCNRCDCTVAPWRLDRLFIFGRYSLRTRIVENLQYLFLFNDDERQAGA